MMMRVRIAWQRIGMEDLKVWMIPAISFCCFIVFLVFLFLYTEGGVGSGNNNGNMSGGEQGVMSLQDFQNAMNSSLK